jgi:hypothetical protein
MAVTINEIANERKSSFDSGAASEHLVLSCLYRLGINAFISFGNKKSIDIIIKADNGQSLTIDVKSVRDYSSIVVNNVVELPNHFIVAVIYKKRFENTAVMPGFYIIPSKAVSGIVKSFGKELRIMKKDIEGFKDQWHFLTSKKNSPIKPTQKAKTPKRIEY